MTCHKAKMQIPKCSAILGVAALLQITSVASEKVTVDLHSASAKHLLDVNCLYNEDYKDFWVYGYPVELTGSNDRFPEFSGFWTPGQAQTCEIVYYGGGAMPQAKSLSISYFQEGQTEIQVSSKYSVVEENFTDIATVTSEDQGWTEIQIELPARSLVFKFTLVSMDKNMILLDKLTFDLGDDSTVPPLPTTANPIDGDTLTLDDERDYWTVWETDCLYMDDYDHYWAFNCPFTMDAEDELNKTGYWKPCVTNNCHINLTSSISLFSMPNEIKVVSYIQKGARINVSINTNPNDNGVCVNGCAHLGEITNDEEDGWIETTLENHHVSKGYYVCKEYLHL